MVDRDLVLRRLAMLEGYLEQLGPYRGIDIGAYRQDWRTQRIVERTLHLAIETCMDVADHIVAEARRVGADVIILGRRGRKGIKRLLMGSVTANVIGRSPCSVLVVH